MDFPKCKDGSNVKNGKMVGMGKEGERRRSRAKGGVILTVFPTDDSLLKMLYLAMMDITKKWMGHRKDWRQFHSQLEIYFEERLSGRNL